MKAKGIFRYELALYARSGVLASLLVGALVPWVFWIPADPARRVPAALAMCEMFVVLAAPFLLGGLVSREHEEHTAEILFSRPLPRTKLLALRLPIALATLVMLVLLPVVTYRLRGVTLPVGEVLETALPGALYLGAAALAAGALTRSTAAAFLVPAAYWFFDWGTRGAHTGYLTLFARSIGRAWWPMSKYVLCAAAVVCCVLAGWAVARRN